MPKKDRREALEEIKSHSQFKKIPVMVLTKSQDKFEIQYVKITIIINLPI
jgi:CheY-like chemotaxis protein